MRRLLVIPALMSIQNKTKFYFKPPPQKIIINLLPNYVFELEIKELAIRSLVDFSSVSFSLIELQHADDDTAADKPNR